MLRLVEVVVFVWCVKQGVVFEAEYHYDNGQPKNYRFLQVEFHITAFSLL